MTLFPSPARRWIALTALVLVAVLVFALTQHRPSAEAELIVISPHSDEVKEEMARAFSAWHQAHYGMPVAIHWREAGGGTSQILRMLGADYAKNGSAGIDVLDGGGIDPFRDLAQQGLLTRYDPPPEILADLAPTLHGMELIDPGHEWFGTALSGFGILTNERARAAVGLPPVRTWSDLTDPRLAGWISASDPRASGSALAIYEIILQAYGWDKGWAVLMEMSGNIRSYLSSAAASAVEVGLGDSVYGVAIDQYGQAQVGYYGPENVSFILPAGETVITPDSIAILKNPPHLELAQHFVDFTLSRDGQLLWMAPRGAPGGAVHNRINRMSVMPGLYDELAGRTPITTNPFTLPSSIPYSNALATQRRAILSGAIAAWMIDTHDGLARAWKATNAPGVDEATRQRLIAQLVAPPCTQDELLQLAARDWKDPVLRSALVNRWQAAAIDRDKSVLAQLPGN